MQLDPSDRDGTLGLACAQAGAGLTSDATSTFNAAIKRFPKDARFKVEYASMLIKQAEAGDATGNAQAEPMLRSALAIDPSNSQALYD